MFTQFNSLGSQNTKINHVVHELSRGNQSIQSLNGTEPPKLYSKNDVVYMVYKDLTKARLSKPSYRKAIIRRVYNESSGSLTLQGKH
ncbi:hypothetical protein YC2023_069587 [Brassica napus]